MEHLRRKERDTSATVSDKCTLMVQTKLRPFLLREDLVARGRPQGKLPEWLVVDDGHAGCGEAAGTRMLFDTGWSYRRCPSFSLRRAAGRGAPPDLLE